MSVTDSFKLYVSFSDSLINVSNIDNSKSMFSVFLAEHTLVPDTITPIIEIEVGSVSYSDATKTIELSFSLTELSKIRASISPDGDSELYLNYFADTNNPEDCLRTSGGYVENFGIRWTIGSNCVLSDMSLINLNTLYASVSKEVKKLREDTTWQDFENYSWGKIPEVSE